MRKLLLFSFILSLISCTTQQTENSEEDSMQAEVNETAIEQLLGNEAPKEGQKLIVEFVLYDNEPLDEQPAIEDKLNHIAEQLNSKYKLPKETDTIHVHVWRDYEEYLVAQKRITGSEFRGSGGYIFSETDVALFYNDQTIENAEHEFVHASSLKINNELGHKSRWLWEAFAIYEANEFVHPKNLAYLRNGKFPSIAELNGEFDGEGANRIYNVGYLLSEFVIETWGSEKYLELIIESANIEKALALSTEEFEAQWKEFVTSKYLAQ